MLAILEALLADSWRFDDRRVWAIVIMVALVASLLTIHWREFCRFWGGNGR